MKFDINNGMESVIIMTVFLEVWHVSMLELRTLFLSRAQNNLILFSTRILLKSQKEMEWEIIVIRKI